ncbi:MAG: S9 family peptidase, partial [Acidobacteriota bacterium]
EEAVEDESSSDESKTKGTRNLWAMDVATGAKEILVPADDVRRWAPTAGQAGIDERERTRRSRFGVPVYHFSPDGESVLFTTTGQIALYSLQEGEAKVLAPSKHGVKDPKFSPDGETIAFVHQHDLWIVPTAGGEARQVTHGGHELLLHGDLDWVYSEELGVHTGFHFSPDGQYIAFLEMDESSVPAYPITEQLAWQATVDLQRYPKPGDPNPRVRVGIVHLKSGRTAWLDRAAEYIPRIDWADESTLAVQLLNRGQDELELVLADPATGRSRSVLFERDEHWVGVTDDLSFLADGERFLWTSLRSGLRHIYLYDRKGTLIRQLTDGEFRVTEISGVDEDAGWVYYTSNEDNLLGRDLYRVRLDGSTKERLTTEKGTHGINMNADATAWVESYSALDPSVVRRTTVRDLASGKVIEIFRDRDLSDYGLVQPEIKELQAPDGAMVRVLLMKPERLKRGKKHPMLIYVYGMAGVPTIRDTRRGNRFLFHQFLVQQGYVVGYIDDRSSSIPGHKYAVAADQAIGPVAAADAEVAVEYFRSLSYVDSKRLGIWGWSGGGFTTCYQMGHTDLYKVGIAGAPVTDWRLYDSIYTERYMNPLQDSPEAYEETSALSGATDVSGRLLLIHGTHDDNVHPQNTLKMVDELIKARKQFDLMLYPNKTHGIRGADHNMHLYTMMFEFLERHL